MHSARLEPDVPGSMGRRRLKGAVFDRAVVRLTRSHGAHARCCCVAPEWRHVSGRCSEGEEEPPKASRHHQDNARSNAREAVLVEERFDAAPERLEAGAIRPQDVGSAPVRKASPRPTRRMTMDDDTPGGYATRRTCPIQLRRLHAGSHRLRRYL
jgi:hypothetical protein